ncbi:hypothetical protein AUV07_15595 [Microbacterium sp. CH1]|nr:hypothetical protein AUV07_15595 [Microbacterium sp. CH1]
MKPAAVSFSGRTQRLLSTSSVSVRMPMAPSSSIQRGIGGPTFAPSTRRTVAMKAALSTGCGEAALTGPSRAGVSSRNSMMRATSSMWIQLKRCRPRRAPGRCAVPAARRAGPTGQNPSYWGPPRPSRARVRSGSSTPPSPRTMAVRRATRRVPGSASAKRARSHALATSTEKPVPISPEDSVIGRSSACR